MPNPKLPTTRIDCTVLPMLKSKLKSVVSRPRPLSLLAFGSLVQKRTAIAGRPAVSVMNRTFVPMVDVLEVARGVAGDREHRSTAAPGSNFVIDR